MINNLFYSKQNKDVIKSIINDTTNDTSDKTKINFIKNYDVIIDETMKFVLSQVSNKPPKGVKEEEYLFLMNKKVYDIVTPIIIEQNKKQKQDIKIDNKADNKTDNKLDNKIISKKDNKKDNNLDNNIFDPVLLKNFEIQEIIDYPKPSFTKGTTKVIDTKIKSLENERSTLIPKLRPIDFTIKDDDKNKQNTIELYDEMLKNMNKFEIEQNNISINNENSNSYTPIELLKNNNNNENSNSYTPIELLRNNENITVDKEPFSGMQMTENLRADIELFSGTQKNSYTPNNILRNTDKNTETFIKNENTIDYNNYSRKNYNNLEFSNTSMSLSNIMLNEPKFVHIKKKFFIIFDSKDRDLYLYPNPTSFQVKFAPGENNLLYSNFYDENNVLIIREKKVVYANNSDVNVNETFDNIYNIKCNSVVVPLNLVNFGIESIGDTLLNPNNVFKEPYLFLVIPEVEGPYKGGNLLAYNAFAKLIVNYGDNGNNKVNFVNSNFTLLKTSEADETFLYDPVTLGKIDKMTLNITNKTGRQFNFGLDKLFIKEIKEGVLNYGSNCGGKFITTILTIQQKNDEYTKYCELYYKTGNCNFINNHNIIIGDTIYFYDTSPKQEYNTFFEENIKILKINKKNKKNNEIIINIGYKNIIDNIEKNVYVNLQYLVPTVDYNNYYLVIHNSKTNKYYYLKIISLNNYDIIVEDNNYTFKDYQSLKIGIVKKNLSGNNSSDFDSLFNNSGYIVLSVGVGEEGHWDIQINYPYKYLPDLIKNYYEEGNIFLIQEKLQINYTFTITSMIKDYEKIKSNLNESGNN